MDNGKIKTIIDQVEEFAQSGRLEDARITLEQGIQTNPNCADLYSHLGYFYYKQGRFNKAIQTFEQRNIIAKADIGICKILIDIYRQRQDKPSLQKWIEYAKTLPEYDSKEFQEYQIKTRRITLGIIKLTFEKFKFIGYWLNYFLLIFIELFTRKQPIPERISSYIRFLITHDPNLIKEGIAYHKIQEISVALKHLPIQKTDALILDLGTGKNPFPIYGSSLGSTSIILDGSSYGVDVLKTVIENVSNKQSHSKVFFNIGDAVNLPFMDNSIDAVSSICMIEHIPENGDTECMKEIYRVLKPGGMAVVTTETSSHHEEGWIEVPYNIGYQIDGDTSSTKWEEVFNRNYSQEQLSIRLVQSEGWEIIEQGFFDDRILPIRSWTAPNQNSIFSSVVRLFQPVLSILFYRHTHEPSRLSPSSIGYLVLQKPL
jgi:ubiquinone/menaquinone biosynthesis C-methylase UbiE